MPLLRFKVTSVADEKNVRSHAMVRVRASAIDGEAFVSDDLKTLRKRAAEQKKDDDDQVIDLEQPPPYGFMDLSLSESAARDLDLDQRGVEFDIVIRPVKR